MECTVGAVKNVAFHWRPTPIKSGRLSILTYLINLIFGESVQLLTISVYDKTGELVFEGTLEHWKNCFFDNAEPKLITEFCDRQGWKVEFKDVASNSNT